MFPGDGTGHDVRADVREIRCLGPVLLGVAEVHVLPDGESSILIWTEDVHLRGLPHLLTAPLLRIALGAMLRVVVRRLVAEVAARGR